MANPMQRLGKFYKESKRVLRVTKKPTGEEFKTLLKVTGMGMLVIGFIGFILLFAKQLFQIFKFF